MQPVVTVRQKRTRRVLAWAASASLLCPSGGSATSVIQQSATDLVDRSDAIMVATVLEKTVAEDCDDTSIYTYYCLRIEDVLKGNVGKTRFVLRVPGGELPEQGIGLVVPGMPVMATGRRYLLFGLASPKNGLSPTGVWQGVYLFESHPADATRVLVDSAGRMITGLANGDFVRTARPLTKCPGDFVPIHGELGCGWTTGEPGLPTIDWPDTDPSQDPVFLHPQPSESVSRAAWQAYVDRVPVG